MINKIIVAAAGSGKTTLLVERALQATDANILITTFTENNEQEIKKKYTKKINVYQKILLLEHGFHSY